MALEYDPHESKVLMLNLRERFLYDFFSAPLVTLNRNYSLAKLPPHAFDVTTMKPWVQKGSILRKPDIRLERPVE